MIGDAGYCLVSVSVSVLFRGRYEEIGLTLLRGGLLCHLGERHVRYGFVWRSAFREQRRGRGGDTVRHSTF